MCRAKIKRSWMCGCSACWTAGREKVTPRYVLPEVAGPGQNSSANGDILCLLVVELAKNQKSSENNGKFIGLTEWDVYDLYAIGFATLLSL